MKLHDSEYFVRLTLNIIFWSVIITMVIVIAVALAFPFAMMRKTGDMGWMLLYPAYFIVLMVGPVVLALIKKSAEGERSNDENQNQ